MLLHAHEDGCYQRNKITRVGEDVEILEPLCTAAGSVKWCGRDGKDCDGSSKNLSIELS